MHILEFPSGLDMTDIQCLGKHTERKAPEDDCCKSLAKGKSLYKQGNIFMMVTPRLLFKLSSWRGHLPSHSIFAWVHRREIASTPWSYSSSSPSLFRYHREGLNNSAGRAWLIEQGLPAAGKLLWPRGRTQAAFLISFPCAHCVPSHILFHSWLPNWKHTWQSLSSRGKPLHFSLF